jgi:hypothetical protein
MTYANLVSSYGKVSAEPKPISSNIYIVPQDKSHGYDALTHQLPQNQTGYFNIQGAYSGPCTTFGYRGCDKNEIMKTDSFIRPMYS